MPKEDTQWKPGQSGNPSGRPKNTLKDYLRQKLSEMTPEQKEAFLKDIPKEMQWRMGEGNPAQDLTSGGEKINIIPIYGGKSNPKCDSDKKDIQPDEKD